MTTESSPGGQMQPENQGEYLPFQENPISPMDPMDSSNNVFEWEYQMRREMQEIVPGVYLGPYAAAMKTKYEELQNNRVTHIICVRQEIESHWIRANFPGLFEYLVLDIADSPTQNIIQYFPKVREFIDNCLGGGGKVLIHGSAGISRSAALVIAYLMEKFNCTSADAIRLVQRKRFCIFPNEGFRRQLLEYEPILRARGVPEGECGMKRKFIFEEDTQMQCPSNRPSSLLNN